MQAPNAATTTAARGLAEAPYTIANFSLSLSAKGTTVPTAKERLKKQIEALNTSLEDMKKELSLKFIKNSLRTSSSVQEDYEYKSNKHELVGYVVTYNLSFQIDDLDRVNEVYDVLTSLDKVRVANPTFGLKPAQREKLSKKALKNAFEKVTERFKTECEILGLNPNDFEISAWEPTYHDSQRGNNVARHMAARSASNAVAYSLESASSSADDGGEIDLVAGRAEVVVNLEVGYTRKVNQTIRAEVVKKDEARVPNPRQPAPPGFNV
jgi:uncharacterized protein YggE